MSGVLDPFQFRDGVILGLILDGGDVLAEGLLFRLRDANGFPIEEEHIVGRATVGGVFADGLAFALGEVDGVLVLNGPTGGAELCVDPITGDLFRVLVGHLWHGSTLPRRAA